jgi:hypothetical protein
MRPHTLDYYMDGHGAVSYCRICSAEDLQLREDCPQKIIIHDPDFDLTDNKKRLKRNYWNKGIVP